MDWDTPFDGGISILISSSRRIIFKKVIEESKHHLKKGNPVFFQTSYPQTKAGDYFQSSEVGKYVKKHRASINP